MDDEPMWAADRVVAPTLGFAITIPETANEFALTNWNEPQPPPQGHTEQVNAVFTGNRKSDDPSKILKDPPPPIIVNNKTEKDKPIKTSKGNYHVLIHLAWKTHINSNPVSTPMDTSEKLMPNNGQAVPQLEYYRVIGCLMYAMTCTRPGIAFYVGYTDASWISNTEDNSSTSGWVVLLATGKEVEWMKILLIKIPLWSKPISPIYIRCDSAATLAKAYSQIYNGKSRHLSVRHSMIHELIMNGVVSIEFVMSQQNLADHLTKGLARDLVIKSTEGMGLKMCLEPDEKEDAVVNFLMVNFFEKVLSSSMNKEEPSMVQFIPDNGAGVSNSGLKGIHQSDGFSLSLRIPSWNNPSEERENVVFVKSKPTFDILPLALSNCQDNNRFSSVPRPSQRSLVNGTEDSGGSVVLEKVTKEVVQQPKPELRKSKKHRTPKDFRLEFQLYLIEGTKDEVSDQHSYCFNVEDDPKTFDESMNSQDVTFYKEEINDEMDSIYGAIDTCVFPDLPSSVAKPLWLHMDLQKFSMKDMGEADVILGIRIKHESNGIAISQSHYIKKVPKKFNYFDCTLVSNPMDTSEKLMPNNGQAVSQLEYSRVIGYLMYAMTCIRPDIVFDMGKLGMYTSNPVLEGYTDVSWINNTEDNSSTSGWEDEVVNFLMVNVFEKVVSRSMNKEEPPMVEFIPGNGAEGTESTLRGH
ncbi:zinc finger, CCHC-type containing protein [Tanacetum coccineum]